MSFMTKKPFVNLSTYYIGWKYKDSIKAIPDNQPLTILINHEISEIL